MSDGKSLFEYSKEQCGDILRTFGYSAEFELPPPEPEQHFSQVNRAKALQKGVMRTEGLDIAEERDLPLFNYLTLEHTLQE